MSALKVGTRDAKVDAFVDTGSASIPSSFTAQAEVGLVPEEDRQWMAGPSAQFAHSTPPHPSQPQHTQRKVATAGKLPAVWIPSRWALLETTPSDQKEPPSISVPSEKQVVLSVRSGRVHGTL